jgi:hypothetical protein
MVLTQIASQLVLHILILSKKFQSPVYSCRASFMPGLVLTS